MFLLLTTSANPFIGQNIEFFIIVGLVFILFAYPSTFKINIDKEARPILIILFFISFEFIHRMLFELDNAKTIMRIFGYYWFSYFAVRSLKTKFIDTYISIMVFFATVSLIFYIVSIIPGINHIIYNFADTTFPIKRDYLNERSPTLIIYTFTPGYFEGYDTYLRNAGFTWEAGTFGFFLNFALFLIMVKEKLSVRRIFTNRKSLLLIIAMITTVSTTAFTVFCLYLAFFSLSEKGIKKYIMIILVGGFILYSFSNFEFLLNKINTQLEESDRHNNRFGSVLSDGVDIVQRPLFGWSRKESVLFGLDANSSATHRPNGITNQIRNYGLIYIIVFFGILYTSFKKYFISQDKRNAKALSIMLVTIIIISAFSELILDKNIMKSFLFLFFTYKFYPTKSLQN